MKLILILASLQFSLSWNLLADECYDPVKTIKYSFKYALENFSEKILTTPVGDMKIIKSQPWGDDGGSMSIAGAFLEEEDFVAMGLLSSKDESIFFEFLKDSNGDFRVGGSFFEEDFDGGGASTAIYRMNINQGSACFIIEVNEKNCKLQSIQELEMCGRSYSSWIPSDR